MRGKVGLLVLFTCACISMSCLAGTLTSEIQITPWRVQTVHETCSEEYKRVWPPHLLKGEEAIQIVDTDIVDWNGDDRTFRLDPKKFPNEFIQNNVIDHCFVIKVNDVGVFSGPILRNITQRYTSCPALFVKRSKDGYLLSFMREPESNNDNKGCPDFFAMFMFDRFRAEAP